MVAPRVKARASRCAAQWWLAFGGPLLPGNMPPTAAQRQAAGHRQPLPRPRPPNPRRPRPRWHASPSHIAALAKAVSENPAPQLTEHGRSLTAMRLKQSAHDRELAVPKTSLKPTEATGYVKVSNKDVRSDVAQPGSGTLSISPSRAVAHRSHSCGHAAQDVFDGGFTVDGAFPGYGTCELFGFQVTVRLLPSNLRTYPNVPITSTPNQQPDLPRSRSRRAPDITKDEARRRCAHHEGLPGLGQDVPAAGVHVRHVDCCFRGARAIGAVW